MQKPLALTFMLLTMFAPLSRADDERARARHDFEAHASSEGVRRILIDVPPSEINIRTGLERTLSVTGSSRLPVPRGATPESAQRIADAIGLGIEIRGSRATIGPRYGREARSRRARHGADYDFTVTVPAGTHVEVRQSAGSVDVEGDFGDVDIAMHAGEITLVLPKAGVKHLDASTRIGEIRADLVDREVSNEGIFPRSFTWDNETGNSTVRLRVTVGEINVRLTR